MTFTIEIETRRAAGSLLHHLPPPHDTVRRRASRAPQRVGLLCQLSVDRSTWLENSQILLSPPCTNRNSCKNGTSILRKTGPYTQQEEESKILGRCTLSLSIFSLPRSLALLIPDSPFLAGFCLFRSQMGGPPLGGNCIMDIPKATPTACSPPPLCHTPSSSLW